MQIKIYYLKFHLFLSLPCLSKRRFLDVLHKWVWLPRRLSSKESACQCRRPGFGPWVEKIPWRRKWQPTPIFLSGESPWTEEPGWIQSIGSQRVGHDWATKLSTAELPWQSRKNARRNAGKRTTNLDLLKNRKSNFPTLRVFFVLFLNKMRGLNVTR